MRKITEGQNTFIDVLNVFKRKLANWEKQRPKSPKINISIYDSLHMRELSTSVTITKEGDISLGYYHISAKNMEKLYKFLTDIRSGELTKE